MDNSNEFVWIKSRNTGRTLAFCRSCVDGLNNGESVGIIGADEDYPKRCVAIFKNEFKITVIYKPIKELRPKNNRKMHYDKWGEPLWCEILPQTLETIGYKLFKL